MSIGAFIFYVFVAAVTLHIILVVILGSWEAINANSTPHTVGQLLNCMNYHSDSGMANVVKTAVRQTGFGQHVILNYSNLEAIRQKIYYSNAERQGDPFMALANALSSTNAGGSNNPVETALQYIEGLMNQ